MTYLPAGTAALLFQWLVITLDFSTLILLQVKTISITTELDKDQKENAFCVSVTNKNGVASESEIIL